jgi:hypothetical protein
MRSQTYVVQEAEKNMRAAIALAVKTFEESTGVIVTKALYENRLKAPRQAGDIHLYVELPYMSYPK